MERSCLTTLCYLEKEDSYLMLHRVKKKKDINKDKWIGIGGHFEAGESPEECLLREVREETGYRLLSWRFRGLVTFMTDTCEAEYMCLYTADRFEGDPVECEEGELAWVPKSRIKELPIWEGDRIFFDLLATQRPFFSLKLRYEGDRLMEAVLDGEALALPYEGGGSAGFSCRSHLT
ncbi:MAG: 8-oxo-dGTP diphosphatase [Lachnospiraceae bacterium]|nr:8-oxo-dGTP diphosphatase [Lachnospiraceae bacterium]